MIRHNNASVEFTAEDRCDRCIGKAMMLASKNNLELLFCFHHMKKHQDDLLLDDWELSYDYGSIEMLTDNRKPEPAV